MRTWIIMATIALTACGGSQRAGSNRGVIGDTSPYEFHRSLAGTMLRTNQPRQAVTHIRKLQQLRPGTAEPFFLMARAYVQLGANESAQRMFERALRIDPDIAGAHAAIGVLLDGAGEHDRAERSHRRAIELAPNAPSHHNNLGFCLQLQGRVSEAVGAYEEALRLDAGSRRVHNNIGFAYASAGDMDRAYSHFRLAGTLGEAENNLGFAYESRGRLDKARAHYEAALRTEPKLQAARANLDRVCRARPCSPPEGSMTETDPAGADRLGASGGQP